MPARNKVGADGDELDAEDATRHHKELQPDKGDRGGVGICGTILTFLSLLLILATLPVSVWSCVKVVQEYERAVIFRLGRIVKGRSKGPGLFWVIPWLDVISIVDLRTISFNIPPQEVLTADCVTLTVDAVMFYRVVEPSLWVTQVADASLATHTLAQTTLRSLLGTHTLANILSHRQGLAQRMEEALYAASKGWGVWVERVELKDVTLPLNLQRSMAAEAEAVKEARAKMIVAEGEVKASHALRKAASVMSASPIALQLHYLQSLTSVVKDDTSIIVFPFPTWTHS